MSLVTRRSLQLKKCSRIGNQSSCRRKRRNTSSKEFPAVLPALLVAYRIQEKVSSVGFDWKSPKEVVPKIHEEVDEFIKAFEEEDFKKCEEEFGDLLFSLVNLARLAGFNAEFGLKRTNDKFRYRFTRMEELIIADGKRVDSLVLAELDSYWDKVKAEALGD